MASPDTTATGTAAPTGSPSSADQVSVEAATALAAATGVTGHDVAVVLGSGWRAAADALASSRHEVAMAELPGFVPPNAQGHGGSIRSGKVGDRRVLVLLGRTHLYEGHGVDAVVHGVRTAAAAGCRCVVLTNAAGGIRPDLRAGQLVLIADHLNLTFRSPLVGPRFVDLTELYSPRLRAIAREIDPTLVEGVYAGLPGPHYETPAEIRMLRTLGADLVGMSTVLEAIAARAAGLEVCGLSLVSNVAAGLSGAPLNHDEVLAAGMRAADRLGELLRDLVARA